MTKSPVKSFKSNYVDKMFSKDSDSIRSILHSERDDALSMTRPLTSEEHRWVHGGIAATSVLPAAPSKDTFFTSIVAKNEARRDIALRGVPKKNFQEVVMPGKPIVRGVPFEMRIVKAREATQRAIIQAHHLKNMATAWGGQGL